MRILLLLLIMIGSCFFACNALADGTSGATPKASGDKGAKRELCDKEVPEFKEYQPPQMSPNPAPAFQSRVMMTSILVLLLILGGVVFHLRLSRWWLVACLLVSLVILGFIQHGCVCSVGAIGNVCLALFHSDKYVISGIVVVTFFAPLVVALIAGRIFCGAVCPLGAIQELSIAFNKKIPKKLDVVLGLLKYGVLGATIYFAIKSMFLPVCKYDPYVTLFRLEGSLGMWVYTIVFIVLGFFVSRPFCRYLCPYGVLLGLVSLLAFKKREIDQIACINCKKCTKDICPVDAITDDPPKINAFKCVACGRCNNICPKKVQNKR